MGRGRRKKEEGRIMKEEEITHNMKHKKNIGQCQTHAGANTGVNCCIRGLRIVQWKKTREEERRTTKEK